MADELRELNKNIKQLATEIKGSFEKIGGRVGKEINDILTPEMQELKGVFDDAVGVSKDSGKALLNFFGAGLSADAKAIQNSDKQTKNLDAQTELLRGTTGIKAKGLHVQNKGLDKYMKHQNDMLKEQLAIDKRKERKDRSKIAGGKKSWWQELLFWLIGVPLFAIAAGVGLVVAFIVQPFLAIWKILKAAKLPQIIMGAVKAVQMVGRFFVGLGKKILNPKVLFWMSKWFGKQGWFAMMFSRWFGPASKFGKTLGWLSRGVMRIVEFLAPVGRFMMRIVKNPLFRRLAAVAGRGFLTGFSKIFWPLQIIISAIDFVKGFMNTEGTILDKIQGGIKNVFVKFFEWPLMMIGKLFDWVLAKLGLEHLIAEGGSGAKLVEWLGKGIDMIFTGWKLIFGLIGNAVEWVLGKLAVVDWTKLKDDIVGSFKKILGIPDFIKNWILDFFGWEDKLNEKDKESIALAESGAYDEKERRMREAEKGALNRKIAEQVKIENAYMDEQAKYRKQALELQKQANEKAGEPIPIVLPEKEKGSSIPNTADWETTAQGQWSLAP